MKKNLFTPFAIVAIASIFVWADAYTDAQPIEGDSAPSFNLQDQNGDWHTLEDYRGKYVVLFFYPKDGTPGCTTCLLYTSPSPRDGLLSRMPSSA